MGSKTAAGELRQRTSGTGYCKQKSNRGWYFRIQQKQRKTDRKLRGVAGGRIENIDLAAANDAIVIALCSAEGIAADNDERMMHCQTMLERGLEHGMDAADLWFDPLFLVVKGMQDKQMQVLEAIKMFSDMGLNSTGGLSNNSNGMPKAIRPIMDSALVAMAMMQGLTSAIVNPCDLRLMETIKSCDVFKGNRLYADSYLEL